MGNHVSLGWFQAPRDKMGGRFYLSPHRVLKKDSVLRSGEASKEASSGWTIPDGASQTVNGFSKHGRLSKLRYRALNKVKLRSGQCDIIQKRSSYGFTFMLR